MTDIRGEASDSSLGSRQVGRVVGLWRYPVKSMGAEALSQVDVSWHGFAGDRRWAFLREGVPKNGFPWFTLRELETMAQYSPSLVTPTRPDRSSVTVLSPSGRHFDIADPGLAAELSPSGVQLIKQDRGVFDTFPLSLITTKTIARLEQAVGAHLDVLRFRPNILVDVAEDIPFPEDAWVGCVLRIGAMRMRVDKRDGRCVVITIDPATGVRNPAVLSAVTSDRQGCLGVYGTTVQPGAIALGDAVMIEQSA
jgi:uncharacterized protein